VEISIVQAILIALWSGFCLAGMLLGIYTNRCLVMATGVGIILGRPDLGLAMGALGELAYLGYGVSQGGSIPPNAMGPGIVGAIMVITAGVTTDEALALTYPFAVGVQFLLTFVYTFATTLTPLSTKALEQKNFKKFSFFANSTVWVFFIAGALFGLMSALAAPLLQKIIEFIPDWLRNGLGVAGGMLPAVGFAMILNMMGKKETIPFVLIGYVLFAYLGLPTMAIAITAGAIALIVFFNQGKGGAAAAEEEEVVFEDGI
jgi:PTS system N-acetylgalactosamine-specific IIC component